MSDVISKLKIQRTIKEYDFLKSEYDYINQLTSEADKEVMSIVNEYLSNKPALKDIYESKERKIIEDNLKKIKKNLENEEKEKSEEKEKKESEPSKKKSKKSKTLYREIVKKTHPDKVKDNEKLKDLYVRATDSYNEDDAASLYAICDELDIEFNVGEEDLLFFEQNIHRIKSEIDFLTKTFSYQYAMSESKKEKDKVILNFIKTKIS
jgi:phenylalanyl-tRNA synthetase alpha subunit